MNQAAAFHLRTLFVDEASAVARLEQAVLDQVRTERSGRAAGRRVFGNARTRGEHSRVRPVRCGREEEDADGRAVRAEPPERRDVESRAIDRGLVAQRNVQEKVPRTGFASRQVAEQIVFG